MALHRALLSGLLAVLVLAALPFGSVEPWAAAALTSACLGLGIAWVVWRGRRGLDVLPWKEPVLWVGLLFGLVGAVQTIPLPRSILSTISPKAVEMRDRYEPPPDPAPAVAAGRPARDQGWRPVSLYPWATRQATLRFLALLLASLMTIDLASNPAGRRAFVIALTASGAFQAIYGLAEFFSGRQHIFGYVKKFYTDVATGTFINRNHFAGYLEMTLPLAIALAADAVPRLRAARDAPLVERVARIAGKEMFVATTLLILAIIMTTALVCSGSRMGMASAVLACLCLSIYAAWRGRGRGFAVAAFTVGVATLVVLGQGGAFGPISDRLLSAVGELRGSLGRGQIWSQAGGMVRSFPLFGAGLGAFPSVFPAFRSAGAGTALAHAHNDYLELAAEIGLVGCGVALLGAGIVARSMLRRGAVPGDQGPYAFAAATGVAAIMFHSITDFNLAIPGNALTLAVLIGLALRRAKTPSLALAVPDRAPDPRAARALLPAGLMAIGALVVMTPGDSAERLFASAAAIAEPAMADLQALARVRSETGPPGEAGRYVEQRLREAVALQNRGLRSLPTSAGGHAGMGRLEIARCSAAALGGETSENCMERPLREFRAALELSPMSASRHAEVARVLSAAWPILDEAGREEARPVLERARVMNPGDPGLLSDTLAMGDTGEAP